MTFSLASEQTALVIAAIVGLLIGLLLARLASPARRRLRLADAELGRARAELEARDARIRELEREIATARDQVRPLSDEVDRLRRQVASRRSPEPPPAVDMGGAALAGGAMAPSPPASSDPVLAPLQSDHARLPAFLDGPRGTPDNLMLLKGVGPRLAARLNEIGVFHYRQIASWTPEDARIADAKLEQFRGRIERDQLVEQARLLAEGRTTEYEARFGRIGEQR